MKKPFCLWFYGLSGAGKTTLADAVSKSLFEQGMVHITLDGDEFRQSVSSDLGYNEQDRRENIRRAAQTCRLLLRQNITVLASFMTPTVPDQQLVERVLGEDVTMIYVNTPLWVCRHRDSKQIYSTSTANVSGFDLPFDANSDHFTVNGTDAVETLVHQVLNGIPQISGQNGW